MNFTTPQANRVAPVTPNTRAGDQHLRDAIDNVRAIETTEGVNNVLATGVGMKWYPAKLSENHAKLVKQLKTICIMRRPGDGLMTDDEVLNGLAECMLMKNRKSKRWRGLAVYAFAAACNKYNKVKTCFSYRGTMYATWTCLRDGTPFPDDTTWDNHYDLIPITIEWCHDNLKPVQFN